MEVGRIYPLKRRKSLPSQEQGSEDGGEHDQKHGRDRAEQTADLDQDVDLHHRDSEKEDQ